MNRFDSARAAAEYAVAGARECYANQGEVAPLMFFLAEGTSGIALYPHPSLGDFPPVAFAHIVERVGRLYPWHYIVCISEAWARHFPGDTHELERGELERMHDAGDPEVRTSVVALAIDIADPRNNHAELSVAMTDPPDVTWRHSPEPQPEGGLAERIMRAYNRCPEPPAEMMRPPLALLCDVMMASELAELAVLFVPRD